MQRSFSLLCCATLATFGCGFDTTTPNVEPVAGSAGASNSGTSGSSGSTQNTAGAMPVGVAGQLNAVAGASSQGGGGNVAGSSSGGAGGGVGGSPSGGAGPSNGGAGASNGGSGGGTTPPADAHFKLAFRDDFNAFNDARWSKQTHTFDENLARFSANNVVVEGGFLKLRVTKVQNGDKQYSAAEVASKQLFTYGRFVGRIKFCGGGGMVSSLFTYKQNVNTSWQEIDIEHLGYLPKSVQYNLISGNNANRVYQPKVVNLQYSPPMEFHDYTIDWKPDGITFFIDGKQTHQDVQATLKDACGVHMNAWPTNNAVTKFAGTFDPNAVPCEAQYDWIEAYTFVP